MSHGERDLSLLQSQLEDLLEKGELIVQEELPALLAETRPEDLAEALTRFSAEDTVRLWSSIPNEEGRAQVLTEADPTSRQQLIELIPRSVIVSTVEQMDPDDATDLLESMDERAQREVITALEPETAKEVTELLRYAPESAGGVMTSEFVAVQPGDSSREVLALLQRTLDTEVVSYVYVIDEDRQLVGVISIREIIAATPESLVRDNMHPDVIWSHAEDDQEEVARLARKYNLKSIPVVDDRQRLIGVATIDDIVDIISDEADEDIYRLAGSPADHPAQKSTWSRGVARVPWLMFSLSAGLFIGYYQLAESASESGGTSELGSLALLLAFTPLVIGVAGGVGTQSSTLIARGLATGEVDTSRTFKILCQEFMIGLGIGIFMGGMVTVLLYAFSALGQFPLDAGVPAAIGTGLVGGVLIAAVSGTSIPFVCQVFRVDPALVAGPFITALNDVVGGISYLAIARLVLQIQ